MVYPKSEDSKLWILAVHHLTSPEVSVAVYFLMTSQLLTRKARQLHNCYIGLQITLNTQLQHVP